MGFLKLIGSTILTIALIIGFLSIGSFIAGWFYMSLSDNYSCDGVEEWYSNTSFMEDYDEAQLYYAINYNSSELDKGLFDDISDLKEGKPFNCEDFSHLVLCLAEKYDIECDYYVESEFNFRELRNISGHWGVDCLIDNEWVRLN